MSRLLYLTLVIGLIGAGLLLRLVPWGLPLAIHHYGGGILWGAMLYALAAAILPGGWSRWIALLGALAIVVLIEGSRLYHTPALDAFRLTLPGQLLLGRIFSPWNMLADGAGVVIAAVTTGFSRGLAARPRI